VEVPDEQLLLPDVVNDAGAVERVAPVTRQLDLKQIDLDDLHPIRQSVSRQ
jgi:hypothetical protein